MGSDIFAKFSAYIKNPRKEANSSKKSGQGADGGAQPWGLRSRWAKPAEGEGGGGEVVFG